MAHNEPNKTAGELNAVFDALPRPPIDAYHPKPNPDVDRTPNGLVCEDAATSRKRSVRGSSVGLVIAAMVGVPGTLYASDVVDMVTPHDVSIKDALEADGFDSLDGNVLHLGTCSITLAGQPRNTTMPSPLPPFTTLIGIGLQDYVVELPGLPSDPSDNNTSTIIVQNAEQLRRDIPAYKDC